MMTVVVDSRQVREIKGGRSGQKDLSQGLEKEKRREGLLLVDKLKEEDWERGRERGRNEVEVEWQQWINSGGGVCWQTNRGASPIVKSTSTCLRRERERYIYIYT